MNKEIKNISFSLSRISTEQFAIIEDAYKENSAIRIGTNLRYASDEEKKIIAVFSLFVFESNEKPFLIIEAGCHFKIKEESWEEMHNTDNNTLTVPKGFITHMSVLSIGTTRGILHAKTEDTSFSNFVIPTVNVTELIKEDAIFQFKKDNIKK
jgi:hypothetical protein